MDTFGSRPMTSIDTAMAASSWSEMVKGIESSKRTLPWAPQDFEPTRRISLQERKASERELDPISMTFRDSAKERAHTAAKVDRTQTAVLQRVKDISRTQYNMINHIGPPRKIDAMREQLKENEPKPTRKWNMISHLSHDKQTTCPILYNDKYMRANVRPERTVVPPEQPKREFNVITNEFSDNHEARLREEQNHLKDGMLERYWAKHDFDPIVGEYYSDKKENDYRAERVALQKTQGVAQQDRLPRSVAECEGQAYNILTLHTKDEDKLKKALKKDIKKNNRLNKFRGESHKMVERGKREYDRAQEKRLNRVSYKRYEEEINRGYDFVSTVKGSIVAHNLDHLRPKKVGMGYNSLAHRTVHATADTTVPIHYAQGTSGHDGEGFDAAFTNLDSSRHITGGNMSDRRLTNRSMDSTQVIAAADTAKGHMVTPRSKAILNSSTSSRGGGARPATTTTTSGSKVPFSVPSLDLSKAGPATGGVRTGGGLSDF